jgi:hypothetical protein
MPDTEEYKKPLVIPYELLQEFNELQDLQVILFIMNYIHAKDPTNAYKLARGQVTSGRPSQDDIMGSECLLIIIVIK